MKHRAESKRQIDRGACRRSFTLVETLAVIPAVGLLTAAIAMALMLVARSADDSASPSAHAAHVSEVMSRIAANVTQALAFSELKAESIEFRVPDRTGNGREDVIRYSWTGTPGDPLLFSLNQQPPESIIDDVRYLAFTPETRTAALQPLDEELAVIMHHDQAPASHTHEYTVEEWKWCSQCFTPDLPFGTTKWALKRVRFMASHDGDPTGVVGVRIEPRGTLDEPRGVVLEEATVSEKSLDEELGWVEVDFTSLNDLDPLDGLCLVLAFAGGDDKVAKVAYEHGGDPMTGGTNWLTSSNAGGSWSDGGAGKDMRFYILGTYDAWVPSAPEYLMGLHTEVQAGSPTSTTAGIMASLISPLELGP